MLKCLLFIVLTVTSCWANHEDSSEAYERYIQAMMDYAGKSINAEIQSRDDYTFVSGPLTVFETIISLLDFAKNETYSELLQFANLYSVDEAKLVSAKIISLLSNQPENTKIIYGSVIVAGFNRIFTELFTKSVYDITQVTVAVNADSKYPDRVRRMVNNIIADETNCSVLNAIPDSCEIDANNQFSAYFGELIYVELPACNLNTSPGIYYGIKNTIQAQYIYIKKVMYYAYSEDLQAQIVKLPFKDGFFDKLFIVPDEKDGYKQVAQKLASSPLMFQNVLNCMKEALVNLGLPNFDNLTTIVDSKKNLQKASDLKTIYDRDTAEFENITTCGKVGLEAFSQNLMLTSNVVQDTDCDCTCGQTGMAEYYVLADRPAITYVMRQDIPVVVFVEKVQGEE